MATNEENVNLGRVVTAAHQRRRWRCILVKGRVLPVLADDADDRSAPTPGPWFTTSRWSPARSVMLFKKGATISAAMGGCMAEVGCRAPWRRLCSAYRGDGRHPDQALMAAEIAAEHHLRRVTR
ncbi:MAG: L-serine ammonia-lyase, iron-sulfur-dependent, subunit alpha [Candidatus Microthrix sp.]|uniref:L-serine ammonia-lyase, iron-sulfur-dependent, subunit alpha n=1 Tax=Candidatus Neomicrothrix subdominans TaxID=2954438 RepID=A0A936NFE4_9ACTN|nr:L-serine ammonia-lyase, iron-sulfur-dependent, subunit alpha [Candidatus Microthrix subdominans]